MSRPNKPPPIHANDPTRYWVGSDGSEVGAEARCTYGVGRDAGAILETKMVKI